MICPGIVTNVTNFGAFVDIGVHQDGLVHLSEMANHFISDPRKVVNPGDQVTVKVLKVDGDKNQISLSMKMGSEKTAPARKTSSKGKGKPGGQRSATKGARGGQKPSGRKPNERRNNDHGRSKPAFNNPFAAALGDLNVNKK